MKVRKEDYGLKVDINLKHSINIADSNCTDTFILKFMARVNEKHGACFYKKKGFKNVLPGQKLCSQ